MTKQSNAKTEGTVVLPKVTIDEALNAFLAEQEIRLAASTFQNYDAIIDLFRASLNGYAYQNLDDSEQQKFDTAYNGGDEEAFVHLFGPEKIGENVDEFLSYFMVRKVMCGADLLRAAGTVMKKLAKWLGSQGYLSADEVFETVERGKAAARDLPRAERFATLLYEESIITVVDATKLSEDDVIEDYLAIEKVAPGELWFEGGIGPVHVRNQTSIAAQAGWSVNIVLGRTSHGWKVLEVGNVYP